MTVRSICIAVVMLVANASTGQTPPTPQFDFGTNTVMVTGVGPRGTVYVFSIARERNGYFTNIVDRERQLTDDDGDGRVQWRLDQDVPFKSIWLGVDLSSGAYAVAAPSEYLVTRVPFADRHFKKDVAGEIAQLAYEGSLVDFVVVRPHLGVWRTMVASRSSRDEQREPGKISISTEHLDPRSGTSVPPPKRLKKGDVVFILNSARASYSVTAIGE